MCVPACMCILHITRKSQNRYILFVDKTDWVLYDPLHLCKMARQQDYVIELGK